MFLLKKVFTVYFLLLLCTNAFAANVVKKDGTVDSRPNDLIELCRDYVHFRNKIIQAARNGDTEAANEARSNFNKANNWLSEYRDADVAPCIEQAEDEILNGR